MFSTLKAAGVSSLLGESLRNSFGVDKSELKIGVLADPHIMLAYDPESTAKRCTDSSMFSIHDGEDDSDVSSTFEKAPLGRLGCDPPTDLIDHIMRDAAEAAKSEPFDYILMVGDVVAHHISLLPDEVAPEKYELLKKTHTNFQNITSTYFPDVPVFITFGNNDCKYHDNAPF